MENIKLLIAISDQFLTYTLKNKFFKENGVYVVGCTNDGNTAINLINKLLPDIVLIDTILASVDGLSVLEYFAKKEAVIKPNFIMLTSVDKDEIIKKCMELGASYYFLKPIKNDIILKRVKEIYKKRLESLTKNGYFINSSFNDTTDTFISNTVNAEPNNEIKLEQTTIHILHNLGIPQRLNGYRYICEGIKIVSKNKDSLESITKCLYPEIAKIYNTKSTSVERSIRHAIELAWSNGCEQTYNILFSYPQNRNKKRPTNSEFMLTIVEYLKHRKKLN